MGSGCTRNTNATKIEETVLTLPQYKSNSESIFKSFDEKMNWNWDYKKIYMTI